MGFQIASSETIYDHCGAESIKALRYRKLARQTLLHHRYYTYQEQTPALPLVVMIDKTSTASSDSTSIATVTLKDRPGREWSSLL